MKRPGIILALFFAGCVQPGTSEPPASQEAQFANELIRVYWTGFDYNDTSLIRQINSRKEVFHNYASALSAATPDSATASIRQTLSLAAANPLMYYFFCGLFEQHFYNPNSPLRDELRYITVLEHQYASPAATAADKERAKTLLALIARNNAGGKATDFSFISGTGSHTLYDVKAARILLLFYNPACESCAETIRQMKASGVLQQAMSEGRLTVVAIYPDGDTTQWKQNDLPHSWINGHDQQQVIKKQRLYDLKAIPSLYLLDADKNVLLKDATLPAIEALLAP